MLLLFISFMVLYSIKVNAQIYNLKLGMSYKNTQPFPLSKTTQLKAYNLSMNNNDNVYLCAKNIHSIDSLISKYIDSKATTDSSIATLKKLLADTATINQTSIDTAKINNQKTKICLTSKNELKSIDSLQHIRDSVYRQLLSIMDTSGQSKFNYPYRKISVLTKNISSVIDSLRQHKYLNRTYIATYLITLDTLQAKNSVINIQDSISDLIRLRTAIREYRKATQVFTFFPAISERSAKTFFGNTLDSNSNDNAKGNTIADSANFFYFQDFGLLYTNNNSASNTTLHSQLFAAYAGPVRLSASAFFNLPKSDSAVNKDSINAFSALANGGGNVTIEAQFPLLSFELNRTTFANLNFSSFADPKFSFDLGSNGTSSGKYSNYGSLGIVNRLSMVLDNKVAIYGQCNYSLVWGSSTFLTNLGLTGADRKMFDFLSYTLGIGISQKFGISITGYHSSSSAISHKLNNTISFVTNF